VISSLLTIVQDSGRSYDCCPAPERSIRTWPSYLGPGLSTCNGSWQTEYALIRSQHMDLADEDTAYIATIFWGFELLLLKYSILCLYLRIFPNVWLKRAVYFFMAFSAAFTLPLLGLAAFQCIPISAIWDLRERPNAKCIDWITVLNLTVVYEVISETVLFGLPIPIVLKLQMKTSKKIQLMIFFGLGVV
jgi:hypothetical protein